MLRRAVLAYSKSAKVCGLLTLSSFSLSWILLNHNTFTSYSAARETDPQGTYCLYSVSAHVLQCTSNGNDQVTPIIVGPEKVTSGTGACRDNPGCVGRKYKKMGPIEPGNYRINRDTRVGGEERFRLEPIPPLPGWRVWLPSWMPGSLRGGFLMGIGGLITHGCINILNVDSKARSQFQKLEQRMEAQPTARNELVVVP